MLKTLLERRKNNGKTIDERIAKTINNERIGRADVSRPDAGQAGLSREKQDRAQIVAHTRVSNL